MGIKKLLNKLVLLSLLIVLVSCGKEHIESSSLNENSMSDEVSLVTSSENISQSEIISLENRNEQINNDVVIKLNKKELVLVINKYEYLTATFPSDYSYDLEGGTWSTSNSNVVEVSKYGKVSAIGEGSAYVTYTSSNGDISDKCLVYVVLSKSDIEYVWNKVTDMETIKNGDILVFGCHEFNVTASLDRVSGYLEPTETRFSSNGNQIIDLGINTCEFFVGETDIKDEFTLESQDGLYLAGKTTDRGNSLSFVKDKGQIHWIFETPEGYDKGFCVNADIETDLWLMFNKINSSDICFNLYDSNETKLMKIPNIYRKELVIKK